MSYYPFRRCSFCYESLEGKPCKNKDCKKKARKAKRGGSGASDACLSVLAVLELDHGNRGWFTSRGGRIKRWPRVLRASLEDPLNAHVAVRERPVDRGCRDASSRCGKDGFVVTDRGWEKTRRQSHASK
ncbi:hypothetical protein MAPG_09747 [Magnaporthiopsis poae ATCC 64411]|uniref:Uncharacterized protein n=1 Tax=Magnaporthiopsis poae (strain ATCC 64411 / 73-15) TaxID=644358 RepID=A0A0C4EAR8_MAGP6|nr:hypothetical protein MAPG_09747 [Magnaporthiopsis poae ATCC 64411]